MSEIWMIEIHDYHAKPPTVSARFWWSKARGVTCDDPKLLAMLSRMGIRRWIDGESRIFFPHDGRAFFDTLPYNYSGMMRRATLPVRVDEQGGEGV